MYGTLKLYVPVTTKHPFGERQGLKQVYLQHGLEKKEAEKATVEFCKMNPRLPIVRAVWSIQEDLSLNFTTK